MTQWRRTAKIIATTFLVTSAAWLIAGAILFERMRQSGHEQAPQRAAATDELSSLGAVVTTPASVPRLIIPGAGVRRDQLTDTFTQSRQSGARAHNAIDIMAPLGTPVIAAAAGQVEKLFVSVRGGNTVYVRSPDRTLIFYYAHLDAYAPGLAEMQAVRQGQPLGTVGFSGDASPDAPHLHFEIQQTALQSNWWQRKVSLNPYPLLIRR